MGTKTKVVGLYEALPCSIKSKAHFLSRKNEKI